jgi:hypothetical protein
MNRNKVGLTVLLGVLFGLRFWAATAEATSVANVDVHGFISQGFLYSDEYNYLAHNSTDGTFEFNEIGINFNKNVTDRMRLGIQFFSRDLGDISNNKVTLDWAYGDYRWRDWLGIRAGKIKLPGGLYNEIRDMDMLCTHIIMPQGVYKDLLRETFNAASGGGLYGIIPLGVVGELDYQFISGAISADSESGQTKYTNNVMLGLATQSGENEYDTIYSGSIRWYTPLEGLLLNYSNFSGSIHSTLLIDQSIPSIGGTTVVADTDLFSQILSLEYTWNGLVISGEYYWAEKDIESILMNSNTTEICYYLAASYKFSELFTLGAYYSEFYPDKDDKNGDKLVARGKPDHGAWQKDLAMTLRFDLNDYWVFKVEGHMVDGTADLVAIDNPDSDRSEDKWYYGATKMTFCF